MQNSSSARPHRTAAQRAQIITDYQRSDLTQKAFAAQAGIGCLVNANYSSPSVTIKTHHFTGLPFVFHSSFH